MKGRQRDYLLFVGLLCLIITITESATVRGGARGGRSPVEIAVGVILDSNSSLGSIVLNCTSIGLQDVYSTYHHYSTNITLHFRESGNDLLTAASAAWDLIDKEKVHAILGPQKTEQARFVVELGYKAHVPVIWFSPSGPSLRPPRSLFVNNSNSSRSQCFQFEAIAAIIEAYKWQSVIPIYEEPEFGNDLIPCLTYALQDMDTRVPYICALRHDFTEDDIIAELNKIKDLRTYVFLAHMTLELWSRLVEHAQKVGLMSEGYAWILAQGLSSALDPEALDKKPKGYMDSAWGVKPSLAAASNIIKRLSLATTLMSKYGKTSSIDGLWAYDTITALANAVEKVNSTSRYRNETGPELRKAILETDFRGLSGNFSFRRGQLDSSPFVVYKVKGQNERIVGYWSPKSGLVQYHGVAGETIGPGNTTERLPKLRIGVPKTRFPEFVDVTVEGHNVSATGFAVDVFKRVVDVLQLQFPLPYDFVPLNNANGELTPFGYDDLLCNITSKNLDVIIGDITILTSRTDCVEFTMPYLDSSVSMAVKVGYDSKSEWILFTPFDWLLWLILSAIFVAATALVIILERKAKDDDAESKFEHFVRNPFFIYLSDVDSLKSRVSKWVVIAVVFLLGLAMQLYTANLTSILTKRTMAKPFPWKDLQEIKRNNVLVGYQNDSWVKDLLIHQIGLKDDQLKALVSCKEYGIALSKGAKKGGVDVIIDETPYLRLLLSQCSYCEMTGPIYKTGGFAFAFPRNPTLVSSFSSAILSVTQNVTIFRDLKKSSSLPVTIDKSEYKRNVEWRSLTKDDFGGLFPIVYSVLALFFAFSIIKAQWLQKKWVSFWSVYGRGFI